MSGKVEMSSDRLGEVCAVGSYVEQVFTEVIVRSLPRVTDVDLPAESARDSVDHVRGDTVEVVHSFNTILGS